MSVTSIRLNAEVEAPLQSLSEQLDRSKNYRINQAIKVFIARQSMEGSRWEDTLKALSTIKKGDILEEGEVVSWIKSWGTENALSPPTK
jgi:predicted transcriptional regulator